MKFIIGSEAKTEVKLTLAHSEYHRDMIELSANGKALMGFKNGKYQLFSNADKVNGLVLDNSGLIVQGECL